MTCYFHRLFCKNNELFSLDSRLESVRTAGPESRDWCKYCGTEDRQTSLETINMGICSTRAGFILTSHRTGVGSLMWQQYVIVSMRLRERPNRGGRLREDRTIRTELAEGIAYVIARILTVTSFSSDFGPPNPVSRFAACCARTNTFSRTFFLSTSRPGCP